MDYKEITEKIKNLKKELFDTYIEALKNAVKENGVKTSMFCSTLYMNVYDYEVEYYSSYKNTATLDEIYYIPEKDELGFIVWDNEMHTKTYANREFRPGDINMLSTLFNFICKCCQQ